MKILRPRVILLLLLLSSSALAVRTERLIDKWRPQHYLVNITLNDQLTEISSASARIYVKVLKPTRVIDLDFGELTVDRVTLNSKPLEFTHKDENLLVTLSEDVKTGDVLALTVDYHGKPKDGLV